MTPSPTAGRGASWRWLAAGSAFVSLLVAGTGLIAERWWFGPDEATAVARVRSAVKSEVDQRARALRKGALALSGRRDLTDALAARPADAQAVFALLDRIRDERVLVDGALTVYGADGVPIAWSGRASPLPSSRLAGPAALFVAPGALGLRLVWIEPIIVDPAGAVPRRLGAIAAERVLSPNEGLEPPLQGDYRVSTTLSAVILRPRFAGGGPDPSGRRWLVTSPSGEPIVEAELVEGDLAATRYTWRRTWAGAVLGLLALSWLALAAPVWNGLRRSQRVAQYLRHAAALSGILIGARLLLWWALPPQWARPELFAPAAYDSPLFVSLHRSPLDFLLTALLGLGLVVLAADAVNRATTAGRAGRRDPDASRGGLMEFVAWQVSAGFAALMLVLAFEALLGATTFHIAVDPLHLSLSPWDWDRLMLLAGLLLLHAAAFWAVVLVFLSVQISWRVRRASVRPRLATFAGWLGPSLVVAVSGQPVDWQMPWLPLLVLVVVAAAAAWRGLRRVGWFRHGSQLLRLGALAAAIIGPSLLLYPSLVHFAEVTREREVEGEYSRQVVTHPQELQSRLDEVLVEIDRLGTLAAVMESLEALPDGTPRTEAAFALWRQTALARARLTSAIELYVADGRLASRFALSFPEYASRTQRYQTASCQWEVFGEAAPFGAEERRMLHAERGVCDREGRSVGAIVVHVMLDYSALSFISSQSPSSMVVFNPGERSAPPPARDLELVVYGWGRTPIYTSSGRAWPLDEATFSTIYASRTPFWTRIERGGRTYRVYFANDRAGIYAVGYPVLGAFDHLIRLAEVATLAALVCLGLMAGATLVRRLGWPSASTGRTLVREFRRSFYRKLALAFVLAAVVPVLILAFSIRVFVAARLRADVDAQAARTASVAQRVIEESLVVTRAGEVSIGTLDDDLMVWISRVIDQEVNVFSGPDLVATSERDLVASGLLPVRAPDGAYRAVALERLPIYVGEDEIGGLRYLMAAAPVSANGRHTFLTVPMALRQREIEREIDELDQGVHLGAVVFILLGAAVGFWMAERISDPVRRLTRASQRIAAGNLDTRVFVRSADELKSLVEAFNRMAMELQRQRSQLERTNRLEAWAEMARQVAHDIKNPLTPIQLSAEHLRRVHRDRGLPLSPVLETCIDTILKQVRLLRQIAGEFSSFASTPSPRPVPTHPGALVREVVDAYAVGLAEWVALEVVVAPDLPEIVVDRTLIGRALTNVLENALHAMPGGGRLRVEALRRDEWIVVEVVDSGVGMDAEAVERIFEPYFSTKAIGTGLGLTIAKRNVELHGGTVEVSSALGAGTTVRLSLPVGQSR